MAKRSEKFIIFYLGEERYALPVLSANQFIEFENIMPIPNADPDLKGLTYHNGNIITIIDLKRVLKVKTLKSPKQLMCLTFESGGYNYGLLVDQGGETVSSDKVFTDRQKKVFKRYFKTVDKQKIYILEEDEILSQINIYDQ